MAELQVVYTGKDLHHGKEKLCDLIAFFKNGGLDKVMSEAYKLMCLQQLEWSQLVWKEAFYVWNVWKLHVQCHGTGVTAKRGFSFKNIVNYSNNNK